MASELLLGTIANEGTELLSPTTPDALRAKIKRCSDRRQIPSLPFTP